jgi:hypothetical protein
MPGKGTAIGIESGADYAGMYENIRDFFAGSGISLPTGHGLTIIMNKGISEWLKLASANIGQPAVQKTGHNINQVSEIVRLIANLITRSR